MKYFALKVFYELLRSPINCPKQGFFVKKIGPSTK